MTGTRDTAMPDDDFRLLLEAEMARLRRVASRIAPAGVDAEDLAHDALERAWRSRSSFRGDAPFTAWLYRILTNRAADLAAKKTATPVDVMSLSELGILGVAAADPAALLARAADGERMRIALARLSAIDRVIVVLHDGEGMGVREIAEACGLNPAAAHKRLQRARVKLVKVLLDAATLAPAPQTRFCIECCTHAANYLQGNLDASQHAAIQEHLRICDRCPPLAQAAFGLREALDQGLPASSLHDQVTTALRADSPS